MVAGVPVLISRLACCSFWIISLVGTVENSARSSPRSIHSTALGNGTFHRFEIWVVDTLPSDKRGTRVLGTPLGSSSLPAWPPSCSLSRPASRPAGPPLLLFFPRPPCPARQQMRAFAAEQDRSLLHCVANLPQPDSASARALCDARQRLHDLGAADQGGLDDSSEDRTEENKNQDKQSFMVYLRHNMLKVAARGAAQNGADTRCWSALARCVVDSEGSQGLGSYLTLGARLRPLRPRAATLVEGARGAAPE